MTALNRWHRTPPQPAMIPSTGTEYSWSNDPSELLRDVTKAEPLPWAIRAPYGWFCHMCDSTCRAGEVQMARIQPRLFRRPMIVTQPVEWRHHLQHSKGVNWRYLTHITRVLEKALNPGTAIRWNPEIQRLDSVSGPVRDWRDLRNEQKRRRYRSN